MHDSVLQARSWLTHILCALLLGSGFVLTAGGQNQSAQRAVENQKASDLQSPGMRQQSDETVYYAESWKKGSRQIQEHKLNIRLDSYYPRYESVVKDASGKDYYKLTVEPYYRVWDASRKLRIENKPIDPRDSGISHWKIRLIEPDEKTSVLETYRGHSHTFHIEDFLTFLDAIEDESALESGIFGVSISRKRVIKVEGFYCVIKVKSYQFSRTKARAFEWLELEMEFTNNYKPGWRWN